MKFPSVEHFYPAEFPGGSLEHIDPALLLALDEFRDRLGRPVYPSPIKEGWVRFEGSKHSRHYAEGRLSDAGDVFVEGNVLTALELAKSMPVFGGIGVYADTEYDHQFWPMLHLDLRPGRTLWARKAGCYYYPHRGAASRSAYYQTLLTLAV